MYHRIAADRLRACAISADGCLMALGGFDARLNVCNLHEGARLHSVEQHEVLRGGWWHRAIDSSSGSGLLATTSDRQMAA